MATSIEIHPIQSATLMTLLFKLKARFSELNKLEVPSDQFNFHIKTLLKNNLIEKTDKGFYQLTNGGKEFANRFDTEIHEVERQAKVGVLICALRKRNGISEVLMQQRLKQPYYGFWGFITGKIRWGESIIDTARREFKEETGLTADFQFAGVKHKTDYDREGNLLEDKFFFVIKGDNPIGKLNTQFEAGRNRWVLLEKVLKINGLFPDVETTLKMALSKNIKFKEFKVKVDKY